MKDEKQTGELNFDKDKHKFTTTFWGSEINSERFDFTSKVGYVWKEMPFQSIGFQNAFTNHNQQSYFGLNQYDIKQQSYYSNLIFNSIISNTMHKFSTGLNFMYDKYSEYINTFDVSRIDNSVGAFFEYTFDNNDKLSYVLGGRMDYHNRLGAFFTPRFHLKYNAFENSVFRISAGRGKRAANIFAENQNLFASSRTISIMGTKGEVYGLNPEIAWNYGVSFTQKFKLFSKAVPITTMSAPESKAF
jgi:outer membrane receptor for ferrienterochelin and colicin